MTTLFDPKKTAVLSLHMVNDIASPKGKFGPMFGEQVVARDVANQGKALVEYARSQQIPVIHVAVRFQPGHTDLVTNSPLLTIVKEMDALVEGTWGADFIDEIQPLDGETIITHQRVGAFQDSQLHQSLQQKGIEHLILFGVVTNNIVEHTARNGVDYGYYVTVVEDCCAAPTLAVHQASIENMRLVADIKTLAEITSS